MQRDKGYGNGKTTRKENNNKVEWVALEQENKYKCIGTFITADTRCIQEIKRRIGIAKKSFRESKGFMKSNVNMNIKEWLLNSHIF